MKSYFNMWLKWSDFKGTTSVKEFWIALLFDLLISCGLAYLLGKLTFQIFAVFFPLYMFLTFIPKLSLLIRRLHDTDKTVLSLLWLCVPALGWIILFVALISKSRADRDREFDKYHW